MELNARPVLGGRTLRYGALLGGVSSLVKAKLTRALHRTLVRGPLGVCCGRHSALLASPQVLLVATVPPSRKPVFSHSHHAPYSSSLNCAEFRMAC